MAKIPKTAYKDVPQKCPICGKKFKNKAYLIGHIDRVHKSQIPNGWSASRYENYLRTGKDHGNCIVCKEETDWNESTWKYGRLCNNPKCKKAIADNADKNNIKVYGKAKLLDDPEMQRKLVYSKKTSGRYHWVSDDSNKFENLYDSTVSYKFLEMLDVFMNFEPSDVFSPSPNTYPYQYEGETHAYIPDHYIASLNLEVEIKEPKDNQNMHPKIQAVDKVKERLKDEAMMKRDDVNYIKINGTDYSEFFAYLSYLKNRNDDIPNHPKVVHESIIKDFDMYNFDIMMEGVKNTKNTDELLDVVTRLKNMSDIEFDRGYSFNNVEKEFNTRLKKANTLTELTTLKMDVLNTRNQMKSIVSSDRKNSNNDRGNTRMYVPAKNMIKYIDETLLPQIDYKINKLNGGKPVQESFAVLEACKNPEKARELAVKVQDLAKKYDANYFFVTDGASSTHNEDNSAVAYCRNALKDWESQNGFDPDEDWSNNPDDFSEYKLSKHFYFYHMVPKGTKLSPGITSLKYQYDHKQFDIANKNADKYRERLVNGWDIYPNKKADELTLDEIIYGVDKYRGDNGSGMIYFFKYPPYKQLGHQMSNILDNKDIYRIDLDDPNIRKEIEYIDWGYELSNRDNKPMTEAYYRTVTPEEYFSGYSENDGMLLFAHMSHIGIKFKKDFIAKKYVEKIKMPSNISAVSESLSVTANKDNVLYRPIFVFLSFTGTPFGKVIRTYTKQEFSHASLSLDTTLKNMTSFGVGNNGKLGFVPDENIDMGEYANNKDSYYALYMYIAPQNEFDIIRNTIDEFKGRVSELKYSFRGCANLVFGKETHDDTHFFCSEFVSNVLGKANPKLLTKDASLYSPGDLVNVSRFVKISSGKISEYNEKATDKEVKKILTRRGFTDVQIN